MLCSRINLVLTSELKNCCYRAIDLLLLFLFFLFFFLNCIIAVSYYTHCTLNLYTWSTTVGNATDLFENHYNNLKLKIMLLGSCKYEVKWTCSKNMSPLCQKSIASKSYWTWSPLEGLEEYTMEIYSWFINALLCGSLFGLHDMSCSVSTLFKASLPCSLPRHVFLGLTRYVALAT